MTSPLIMCPIRNNNRINKVYRYSGANFPACLLLYLINIAMIVWKIYHTKSHDCEINLSRIYKENLSHKLHDNSATFIDISKIRRINIG